MRGGWQRAAPPCPTRFACLKACGGSITGCSELPCPGKAFVMPTAPASAVRQPPPSRRTSALAAARDWRTGAASRPLDARVIRVRRLKGGGGGEGGAGCCSAGLGYNHACQGARKLEIARHLHRGAPSVSGGSRNEACCPDTHSHMHAPRTHPCSYTPSPPMCAPHCTWPLAGPTRSMQ
jgi:hypothetical protein